MYEKFFNLSSKPFDLVPNPYFLYPSSTHIKAMVHMEYAVRERAGFILLTGEVGSGKTTLVKDLIKKLDRKVVFAKVFNTRVTSEQLIAMINDDFGIPAKDGDKAHLLRDLHEFLIEQYAEGHQAILIIDEAQNLDAGTLEELRLLSNLETDSAKLLQIVLVGQPELRGILAHPSLRQLRQRISIHFHLVPLDRAETEAYIFHRLEMAGNRNAVSFSAGALDRVYHYSSGIPRLINLLCDFLLLSLFAEEKREVDAELVRDISGELEIREPRMVREVPGCDDHLAGQGPQYLQELALMVKTMRGNLDVLQRESSLANPVTLSGVNKRLDILEGVVREHLERNGLLLREISDALKGNSSGGAREKIAGSNGQTVPVRDERTKPPLVSLTAKKTAQKEKGLLRRIFRARS